MDVRFLRTEPTMVYPRGRLLAVRAGRLHVLAPDGWDSIGGRAEHSHPVTRDEAEEWCEREGWDLALLDDVPLP